MSTRILPADQATRDRAAGDFTTNLVVSAGAGTGKTTLLVERILTAIGAGKVSMSEIAAITFTEKAAGELRERLSFGLGELAALARGEDTDGKPTAASNALARLRGLADGPAIVARVVQAEGRLDRATVTTIHGFCSEILRAHPLPSGLSPEFTVDLGLAGRRLAEKSWVTFIETELGPEGRRAKLWERVLRTFSLTQLAEFARVLAGGSIADDALRNGPALLDLKMAIGPQAKSLADEIRSAVEATSGLTDAPRRWLAHAEQALRLLATNGPAHARSAIETSELLDGGKPDVHTKRVTDAEADTLDALVEQALPFLRGLRTYDAQAEADLFDCLVPFANQLRAEQTRLGLVDFDGLLVRVRELLRTDVRVRAALKRRYRMILVDEFQDTDPIQYEIVFFLAERDDDHAADAYETRMAPGRLFIVGDAKQSIYRFRGADYGAYQRAVGHVLDQGGARLSLTSNFRSTASVLHPINTLFTSPRSRLWTPSSFLPPYELIAAERADDGASSVEVWTTSVPAKANAEERRRSEARALASELPAIAGPGRQWRYADVLVLFRGFSDLAPYLRALREAEIPFVVGGGRTFYERTEIVQAMAVLRAVADPDDQVSLLAYRRGPAGGVPDTELAAAATGAPGPTPALASSDERLSALRAAARVLPVDAGVRHVLEASGLRTLSGLAFEAAQRVANLDKLASAASEIARDGRLSLSETIEALENAFESDEEGDSPLADAGWDAVRVMTIHSAKGLEAPVVILADTAGDTPHVSARDFKACMTRVPAGEFVRLEGPGFRNGTAIAATLDDARHEAAELSRLLYVALTRARDRLFVFGGGYRKSAWGEALASWTENVTHRVLADAVPHKKAASTTPSCSLEPVDRFEAAVRSVVALAAPPFLSPSDSGDASAHARAIAGAPDRSVALDAGRIVHARLAGFPVSETGRAADEADSILASFAATELAERLQHLTVLAREIPVLLSEDGARFSGTIDLLYRDGDGSIVVADFKTDSSDDGAIDRHRAQLEVYVRAVARAMPEERVRAELWMLRTGRVIAV